MRERFVITLIIGLFVASLGVAFMGLESEPEPTEGVALGDFFTDLHTRTTGDGIGVVKIYGPIQTQNVSGPFSLRPSGGDYIVRTLKRFRTNHRVKAVLIRVNSPGGTLGASQEICEQVRLLKEAGKPVVVSMGDMATSGGYYVSALADKIYANPGTITGSIGVISAAINFTELMEKHGIKMNVIKSGANKDSFAFWREMNDEERDLLTELTMVAYEQFLSTVLEGREIEEEALRVVADGRVFTGEQALALNLVDELGGYETAFEGAAVLAGLDPEKCATITDTEGFWESMLSGATMQPSGAMTSFSYLTLLEQLQYTPVMYMYSSPLAMASSGLTGKIN